MLDVEERFVMQGLYRTGSPFVRSPARPPTTATRNRLITQRFSPVRRDAGYHPAGAV